MRLAVKLAYDGTQFHGSQRQPGLRTVEGDILLAMGEVGIDADTARAQFASRTDAGVRVLGNVMALTTDRPPGEVMGGINAKTSDIWLHSYAEVEGDFNPRHALSRWYRYLLRDRGHDVEALSECASIFIGEHDFRNFCRPDGKGTRRAVESISVRELDDELILVDVTAPAFLWNMVRRLVSAMDQVGLGTITTNDVVSALEGDGDVDLGLAPPEGLILMDTSYEFQFRRMDDVTRRLRERIGEKRVALALESTFLGFMDNYCIAEKRSAL